MWSQVKGTWALYALTVPATSAPTAFKIHTQNMMTCYEMHLSMHPSLTDTAFTYFILLKSWVFCKLPQILFGMRWGPGRMKNTRTLNRPFPESQCPVPSPADTRPGACTLTDGEGLLPRRRAQASARLLLGPTEFRLLEFSALKMSTAWWVLPPNILS